MRFKRDFKSCSCVYSCWFSTFCDCDGCAGCAYTVTVEAPVGNIVGYVKQM